MKIIGDLDLIAPIRYSGINIDSNTYWVPGLEIDRLPVIEAIIRLNQPSPTNYEILIQESSEVKTLKIDPRRAWSYCVILQNRSDEFMMEKGWMYGNWAVEVQSDYLTLHPITEELIASKVNVYRSSEEKSLEEWFIQEFGGYVNSRP